MHILRTRQQVPADLNTVFKFFARPENLAKITPPWLGFNILTPSPIPMRQGAVVDYLIKLGPLPTRWRTLITTFEPPHLFVDEQLHGPYSFWHHTHRFTAKDGGTLLTDEVRYVLPFGPLGDLAHTLMIKGKLTQIFTSRHRTIAALFEGNPDNPQLEFIRV